jgi:CheY-like chemotaxis protein
MWVESTLGTGSAFSFTGVFQERGVAPAIPEDFAGLRCLVAGGSANHRAAVMDILASWGALAGESEGRDLIELVDGAQRFGAPYSLVLVDADIPGADSFHLAQLVRESNPSSRVLVMLRTDRPGDAARCRQLGLRSLLKPVRRCELMEIGKSGAAADAVEPGGGMPAEPGLAAQRILLADDSEDNRFLIRSYLKDSECVLDEAADGLAALEKFKTSTYQLVLTDVEMPGLDGYSATRLMRQWERENGRRPTPILALTAHALAGEAQKSADAGCDAHLTKPIRKSVLVEAIRRHALGDAPRGTAAVVDDSLREIVPGYLANRRTDVVALRAALEKSDFATIRMTAHKIKGTGGGYGFPILTELGGAIEAAALAQDGAAIGKSLGELGRYLEEVEVEYRSEGGRE